MKFKDKIVWITGGSSGIGEATAYEFAREGAKLVLSSNKPDELDEVKNRCQELGATCLAIPFDLMNKDEINTAFEKVVSEFGRIDVLYNNGGISQRAYAIETAIELDRKIMEINFFGGVELTKKVLPLMVAQGSGNIAVTSSISGKFGFHLRSAYAASKFAVQGFYETLGIEMRPKGVYVTIIIPGRVQTNISVHALTKDGKAHGQMDDGQKKGITVESCARQVVKAISKNRREALIGSTELLMVHIRRFFPRLFFKIVSRIKPT